MASLIGVFRIGREPEMRYTPSGDAILSLAVVYSYGQKKSDGFRPSQWLDVALFGDRATKLQPYLAKGNQVHLIINDLRVDSYQKKDGTTASSLRGSIADIELIGARSEAKPQAEKPKTYQHKDVNGDDFDDILPF